MSPLTFLLVDDFAAARSQLRRLIGSAPQWQVIGEAKNGEEAIQLARQLRPDIILLDVAMPGVNGIRAAKRIKKHLPETHIIIYSAYNTHLISKRALDAGADAYLNKSDLERETLIALINHWHPHPLISPSKEHAS